jgi:septal ring factor EnvC (AmiA/AmiB activator)
VSVAELALEQGLELPKQSGLLARLLDLIKMQQETIERLNDKVAALESRMAEVQGRPDETCDKVAALESRMAEVQGRLDETCDKVDVLDVHVCELGQNLDALEGQMPDVEEILEDVLQRKIGDEVQEHVEDRIQDMFTRIRNAFCDYSLC